VQSVIVADANVLLSALAGQAAYKILGSDLDFHTTRHTWNEVKEHLPKFEKRYNLDLPELKEILHNPPLWIHEKDFYASKIPEAHRLIGERDPEDVDVAALALFLDVPVWSNDNDFKNFPTKRYTTAQMFKLLGM